MLKDDVIGKLEDACSRLTACASRCEAEATTWRSQLATALREKLTVAEAGVDAELDSLHEREKADYARQVEHVSKLLSDPALYADAGRFAQGLDDETVAWFRRYRSQHHRQREVLSCVKGVLTSFHDSLEKRLDSFVTELRDEAIRACEAEISPLLADVQARLDEIGMVKVDEGEDGALKSAPIVPNGEGLLNVGNFELNVKIPSVGQLPIVLDADRLNVISYSYPPGACSSLGRDNCRALLSNALEQVLRYGLPDTEVHILDGDALLAGFDGCLKNLTRRTGEKAVPVIVHEKMTRADDFSACLDMLARDFSDVLPTVDVRHRSACLILLVPESAGKDEVERIRRTVEDALARWRHWLHVIIAGQKKVLEPMGKCDERFCFSQYLDLGEDGSIALDVGTNRMEGAACLSDWQTDSDRREKLELVIEGLANPPRPISDQAVILKIARLPTKRLPYCLVLDKEYPGTTFIEGIPGSGKSVLLTQMLKRAIEDYTPQQLQLYLLDLKGGLTFSSFDKIPHVKYILNVKGENNVDVVLAFFELLCVENEDRLSAFKAAGVKSLDDYNRKMTEAGLGDKTKARLLVVVDESRIVFSTNVKEGRRSMETILKGLLSTGRSQGLHFIFTSQKRDDLTSDYYDYFGHYFLLRHLSKYEIRHYPKPQNAKEDHDDYRRGLLLDIVPYDEGGVMAELAQMRQPTAPTISLDAETYQTIEGFPRFDEALVRSCSGTSFAAQHRLVAALGVSLARIDSLQTIEFSQDKDKPHLLVMGRPECSPSESDKAMKGVAPRNACLGLIVETLAGSSASVRVTVADPNGRLSASWLPSLGRRNVRHVRSVPDCREALMRWVLQGAGKAQDAIPNVLVVNDAQNLVDFFDAPDEPVRYDVHTGLDLSGLEDILDPGLMSEDVRAHDVSREKGRATVEDLRADFKACLKSAHRHQAYLVLVTDTPGDLNVVLRKLTDDRDLSLFSFCRIVHFDFTGERLELFRQKFDNRSPLDGNVLETREFENNLSARFLPFKPFTRETSEEDVK